MKKLITILFIVFIPVSNIFAQIEPCAIKSVEHAVWNSVTKKYVTWKIEKCNGTLFFLENEIKAKGCNEASYYYTKNKTTTFKGDDVSGVMFQCYNQKGNDCVLIMVFNTSMSKKDLIVTFPEKFQLTYSFEQYKSD